MDRGCAVDVGDAFDGCDPDSDDSASVASDEDLRRIYCSDGPPAKRPRCLSNLLRTKKSIAIIDP